MIEKSADIIIPTYKPDAEFETLLHQLSVQSVKPNKIIIVNSNDGKSSFEQLGINTNELCEVHEISKSEFDHGLTRNLAISFSNADYFICMTQDAVPADDKLVEKLIRGLGPVVKMCYARQVAKRDANEIEKITRTFNYPDESLVKDKNDLDKMGIKTFFASNVCCAYERKIFDELGKFVSTDFNEDMMYAAKLIQAGYSIRYEADAVVYHSHNYTISQQYARNFCLAQSQIHHPEYFGNVKSESEGIKLVTNTANILIKNKKAYLIPELIWTSGVKYTGYKLGRLKG